MGMRNSLDPYGGQAPLVDKMIGNAYDVVKAVYKALGEIKYLASNMEAIIVTAKNLPDTSNVLVIGVAGNRGEAVEIPLPSQVTIDTLVASSVMIVDSEGNSYQDGNGNFLFWFRQGRLRVRLMSDAPVSMAGAEIRWHVTYRIR